MKNNMNIRRIVSEYHLSWKVWLFAIGIGLLVSCSKSGGDNNPNPVDPEPIPVDTIYGKLITVRNLKPAITDDSDPTGTNRPAMYFSLEDNKEVPAEYAKTRRWDISFTGIYNSFIGGNNGSKNGNLGFGGPGKGGIYIVKQKFEDVKSVPEDMLFRAESGVYGTDDSGDFGAGTGWYLYDFSGTIIGNGKPEKQHVVYPIAERTLIVRTAIGNYAKIKMLSLYENELDPAKWFKNTPHPYFTFQYVILKNGNKKFE